MSVLNRYLYPVFLFVFALFIASVKAKAHFFRVVANSWLITRKMANEPASVVIKYN